MIQYLRRKEIDIDKYDNCIQNANNSRIYALSYYLDIVADNWDALVLNDYEAVMPLPWRSKYLIKYIYTPCWTQQLGVFSISQLSTEFVDQFIKAIPKKFLKTSIYFNSQSQPSSFVQKRNNYILDLNDSYENIYKNFNKNRKRVLKSIDKKTFTLKNIDLDELILIAQKDYSFLTYNNLDYENLKKLQKKHPEKSYIYGVLNSSHKLIGGIFFIKDNHRLTYLFSIMNSEGKKENVATLIVFNIIKQFNNTRLILDFEGSMHTGIASFYKSFGATKENYYSYTVNAIQRNFI